MLKRIDELAAGRFSCTKPTVAFSTDRIEIQVLEGRTFLGEFEIKTENSIPLRGKVYSSCNRMECLTPRFEGESVRIQYEFHSEGLMEGDILKGDFFIVCNHAEYNLSFVATVVRLYADASIGMVKNLHDFTNLARENREEAKRIFHSSCFQNILGEKEGSRYLLYQGLAKGRHQDLSVEEFLLACGQKEQVVCSTDTSEATFFEVGEQLQHEITLTKSTWGYVEFTVTSDAPFIKPEKDRITAEDFVGSVCTLHYYILPDEMHAGKNYAVLQLNNVAQQIDIHICASRKPADMEFSMETRGIRQCHMKLMNLYTDFRLKKIVTGKWAKESINVLDELVVKNPDKVWYRLMKAQVFFMNGQKQETEWILSEFKREWKDKQSPQWGYYLYIRTLMEREETYVDRLTAEIERIFVKHSGNMILFWCLLFLEKEYTGDNFRKLKALERRVLEGCDSPLLYVESYCLYLQDPLLLSRFGDFERKVLNWAKKQGMITQKIAEQLLCVFPERMEYKKMVLLLLEDCYEKTESEQALSTVCGYLIKNQKYGKRFFPWYEKGVLEKLRMTGLYEAYLLSMDPGEIMEVPKIILMYFKYNIHLDYRQKAVLYVNIIANREKKPEDYEQYRQSMEVFAYEQMELGHMDDNLAVIYNEVIHEGVHSQKLAEVLSNVLFVHKLTCFDPHALRVIVTDSALKQQQIVPLIGGTAYFKLYSNEYSVFIEDHLGNRYNTSISYQLEKLMYPGRYLRDCMHYAPEKLPYLLAYFSGRRAVKSFEEQDLDYFRNVLSSPEVSDAYQSWLGAKMIRLLHALGNTGEINLYLEKIDYGKMDREEREYFMETLINHQLYDRVYQLGAEYGREFCSLPGFRKCVSHQIKKTNYGENETLLKFSMELFFLETFDAVVTEYLSRYYEGPTKRMEAVWKAAGDMGITAHGLEERILVQMLYTTEFVDSASDIYESYEGTGNKKVKRAYLNYFSYHNFVKDMVPPAHLFSKLIQQFRKAGSLPTVCELALLRHLADRASPDREEEELMESILQKYVYQGIMFAFYRKFGLELQKKYLMYDKCFVEYKSTPRGKVQLRYKSRDNRDIYITEEMTEMYEGIYVKEFILFHGESVQYYISESRDGQMMTTESGTISGEWPEDTKAGCYGMLNELFYLRERGNGSNLAGKMQHYKTLRERTEGEFTIL